MGSEKVCSSSRSGFGSACSSSSSLSFMGSSADRMVEIEIEAAEALADLAQAAMKESGGESGRRWENGKKWAEKGCKRESMGSNLGLKPVDPPARSSDLDEHDQAVGNQKQCATKVCRNGSTELLQDKQDTTRIVVKIEDDDEFSKITSMCDINHPSVGYRSKRNLTEAEKEARKIRRILANRESARQTIRRRQALCMELTRKAADLALENENLKKEKEAALKDYQSLETENKLLKEKVAEVIETEVKEVEEENEPVQVPIAASPVNCPSFSYNHPPFALIFWPSVLPTPNPSQSEQRLENAPTIPSIIPIPDIRMSDSSHKLEDHTDGPKTPFYAFPCPWFFPPFDHGNRLQSESSFGVKYRDAETSVNGMTGTSSCKKAAAQEERHNSSSTGRVRAEGACLAELRTGDYLPQIPVRVPQDGWGKETGPQLREFFPSPIISAVAQHSPTMENEKGIQADCTPAAKGHSNKCTLPGRSREQIFLHSKKMTDALAAAEARRRRKELTRLKNMHGNQCRMPC